MQLGRWSFGATTTCENGSCEYVCIMKRSFIGSRVLITSLRRKVLSEPKVRQPDLLPL